nr:reverse transcriptase domain-containing protein [Tanacetum cinerariifolium]
MTSSPDPEIAALKAEMAEINKNLMRVLQLSLAKLRTYMLREPIKEANNAILKNMQTNMTSLTNSNVELKNMFGQFMKMNIASSSGSGTLLGNTITNPKEDLKGITTRSGTAYQGPTIPNTSSSLPKVVERETEETKDTVHPTNNESTKDVQPPIVQTETPIIEPVVAPVSAPKPNQKPSIPYPSSLLLLKKLPEKLGDPDKFLIPCDFSGMDECLALADLGGSINLMPLSVWNKLSLPELSPTCMTLELVDRSISHPVGVTEGVFVKVGTFHFSTDFVVVDFDADPRVPLILERSFLKTERALIDVFEVELILRVGKEAITFNLDQTLRYSANYNDMKANRIDVIEVDAFLALEDDPTSPEVDQFYFDPEGDILLLEAFLKDDPSLPPPNQGNYLPQVRKELKLCEAKTDKSSIDEPPKVKLKDLPPHLEYTFLEGDDKLPVIIAKDLSDEEKTTLITVSRVTFKFPSIPKINKRQHSRILTECLPTAACLLAYAMHQVEAKALPTNDARVVCNFLKSLFAKFGTPHAIISDRGTHFCNDRFAKVMLKYGVTHRLATAYRPQTSGQVEVPNRGLKRILERTVGENHASWSDKLDDDL